MAQPWPDGDDDDDDDDDDLCIETSLVYVEGLCKYFTSITS